MFHSIFAAKRFELKLSSRWSNQVDSEFFSRGGTAVHRLVDKLSLKLLNLPSAWPCLALKPLTKHLTHYQSP